MLKQLGILIAVVVLILVGAHFIFKYIPKPDLSDRGEPVICNQDPAYPDYPAQSNYAGPVPSINFNSNTMARDLENEIIAATHSGVNFDGSYILVEGSCGVSCQNHAIVDAESGNVVHLGLVSTTGLGFSKDSRLIVVNPTPRNATRFYDFREDSLHYICEKKL